ncbi:hypothetical protein [uncultured Limosilactobacillus sp.]|uniref:hypothetical protein n=1 Tax=uncultured Limosilactobacillus sp. TaxID=2837629 RepID=UPI0025CB972B|nr:hypothetical protein [uncultured Limosilactobacillus sp.]
MRKTINKSTGEMPISLNQKPSGPLQELNHDPSGYDHVYVRAFSGIEFVILISVIILCLFYRFGLALAVLLGGLLFYQKVGIRDPKTGQSWVVSRRQWHQYCQYNGIDWKRWREQSHAASVAKHIKQRQSQPQ